MLWHSSVISNEINKYIQNSFLPTNAPFIKHIKMLKFTLKYVIFSPTCFGPPGPSSGSLCWAWL